MGLFGDVVGRVVMKYEADTRQAREAVKALSGEQKKAAAEAAKGLQAQTEQLKTWQGEFVKGAAIIGGSLLVAQNGLKALREEQRLTSGAAGIDIDRLSTAYGGLKTRMDLLTLAQAGHQGAWKLTTGQIETVIEGMRALEKKGYDTQQVFDKFTDVLKKGKTEGLDDFGISIKDTGDKAVDLKQLMHELGRQVSDVGGNFDQTGDAATRSMVKMQDGLSRLRVAAGQAADAFVNLGVDIGNALGHAFYGDKPKSGPDGVADVYAEAFSRRRGITISGARSNSKYYDTATGGLATGAKDYLGLTDYKLFGGPSDADRAAGSALANFKGNVRQGKLNTPQALAAAMTGLPSDWREVDAELGKRVDDLSANIAVRMARGIATWTDNAAKGKPTKGKSRGGGRGRASAAADGPSVFDDLYGTASGFVGFLGDTATNAQDAFNADAAKQREAASQRFADAQMLQDMAAFRDQTSKEQEKSFLERTFGPIEEFDRYGAAFDTFKSAVQSGMQAWINGTESVGTAVRRSIAQSLGGHAIEMAGMALVAGAHGVYHIASGQVVQGTAELASAAKYTAAAAGLAVLARLASPATGPTGGAAGGGTSARAGRNQDHRADGSSGGVHQSGALQSILVIGNAYDDDSRRVRERAAARALNRATTAYRPPGGASS